MKRLKIFGLLAMVALLAFGLALSCDSSTPEPDEPGSPAPVAHYSLDGGRLGLYFSQDPSRLPRATATSAEEGDHYVLIEELSRRVLSAGLATVGGNAITLKPDQTEFAGQADFTAEVSSDGGISVVGAPDGAGGTIDEPITGEREGSGAYQPGGNQGGQGGQGGTGPGGQPAANKYTVTFNPMGGLAVASMTNITAGTTVDLPTTTRTGYVFGGWETTGGVYVGLSTTVTGNIELRAIWGQDPWDQITALNAVITAKYAADPDDLTIDLDVANLKIMVTNEFRNGDITGFVTEGPLSVWLPYENYPAATNLYFVATLLETTNTITLSPPPGLEIDGGNTVTVNPTTDVPKTFTYTVGNTDELEFTVNFCPTAEYLVVYEGGATGNIAIKDNGTGNNGGTVTITDSAPRRRAVGELGATVITPTLPSTSMVTVVSTNGTHIPGSPKKASTAFASFDAASDLYTITVSPAGFIVTFDENYGGDYFVIPAGAETLTVVSPATTLSALPTPPQRAGYDFLGWNLSIGGTSGEFDTTTTVSDHMTVYGTWGPKEPYATRCLEFTAKNDIIKAMASDAPTKADAIDDLKSDILDVLSGLSNTDKIKDWFDIAALPAGALKFGGNADVTHVGYVNSQLLTTGANARKIPLKTGTGAMPAGLVVGPYTLHPAPSDSAGNQATPGLIYVIGNPADNAKATFPGLIFYPTARFNFNLTNLVSTDVKVLFDEAATNDGANTAAALEIAYNATAGLTKYASLGEVEITVMDGVTPVVTPVGSGATALTPTVAGGVTVANFVNTDDGKKFTFVVTSRNYNVTFTKP